jgi:nucleoid-associated protein EbfC
VAKRTRQQGGMPAKRGRPQGGMPNMQQMMAQVQQMQQDMQETQEQLQHETVSASAGGGMVTVQVTGDLRVTSVTIDPEAVDPQDVDMLADMVTAAVNEGLRAAQELAASKLGATTGGLDLGGLGLPGLQP